MISHSVPIALTLIVLVLGILQLEKYPPLKKIFHFLPTPFWCYFVPMLLGTMGILPERSPVYGFLTTYLLAGVLLLLLLNVDLPSIARLGPTALGALAVGSIGIGLGAVASYAIFSRWLPADMWKGVGALSASWTGGSANMLAVKEALQTSETVFAPMVIVDTVVTYIWMGIMIALAGFQDRWDAWVQADHQFLDEAKRHLSSSVGTGPKDKSGEAGAGVWTAIPLIGGAVVIGAVCLNLSVHLPTWHGILSPSAWAFLIVTAIGIALSLTPVSKLERYGASRWGYLCLYMLLAAMGAKAHLQAILQAPLLLVMAVLWVGIHATLLALYGYFRRVPMFFLAASTQANIGGTASAPIVAGVYQPALAPIGLLLAVAANIFGTYFGYLIAQLCRLVSHI